MSIFGCLFPCAPQLSWRSAIESERCMSERMGASASASQGADGLGLNQGLGLPPGLEPPGSREKKKRVTGFATLKKKFIRRRRLVLLLKFSYGLYFDFVCNDFCTTALCRFKISIKGDLQLDLV